MKASITLRAATVTLAVLAVFLFPGGANAGTDGVVNQSVKGSFASTVTKLKKAITASKLVIVKEVPFTQMLGMVGVKAEKIKSFEIFHPRYGKVIHGSDKNALLVVPLRILVREKGGEILLQYRKPSVTFSGYSGLSALGGDLDKVFAKIVGSVAK